MICFIQLSFNALIQMVQILDYLVFASNFIRQIPFEVALLLVVGTTMQTNTVIWKHLLAQFTEQTYYAYPQSLPKTAQCPKCTKIYICAIFTYATRYILEKKNLGQQVYQNSFCSHKQSSSRSQQVKDMIIIIMYQLCKCVQKAKHLSLANDALLSVTAHRVLVDILTPIYPPIYLPLL